MYIHTGDDFAEHIVRQYAVKRNVTRLKCTYMIITVVRLRVVKNYQAIAIS